MTRLEKWVSWQETISQDLIRMHGSREIYNDYLKIVTQNKKVESEGVLFHNWVIDNYVTFIAMTIRRQADDNSRHHDVISLAKLIKDIGDHPEELTRKWYISLYKEQSDHSKSVADESFTKLAGSGDYFDPQIAIDDLATLHEASKKVTDLATLSIAHYTKKFLPKLTFDEVNSCIDTFRELVQKYILLLTASSNAITPVMDRWQGIFTEVWIDKG